MEQDTKECDLQENEVLKRKTEVSKQGDEEIPENLPVALTGEHLIDFNTLKISAQAKERYAERIMDRDTKISAAIFVAQHAEKVQNDIKKMLRYAEHLYHGDSLHKGDSFVADVFLNGTWVIIVSCSNNTVVTLYNVDFGVGTEFNKQFVALAKVELAKAKEECAVVKAETAQHKEALLEESKENAALIKEYNKKIAELEQRNSALKAMIQTTTAKEQDAEQAVRDVMAKLICKKIF